jgi:tRNA threonylcarbamoyl adenosine modification protein (Sua5/YciO/YrdC/YwlC family)
VAEPAPIQEIDPRHPQPRHIQRAVAVLEAGGIIAYPTDTYYAVGCDFAQRKAVERMASFKRRDDRKPFSLLCGDLSDVARWAIVDNETYRILKRLVPGPYTFVLPATREVPRTALTKQRTVGIRVPDAPVAIALVEALGRPLATTSAALPEFEVPVDAREVKDQMGHLIDLILDGGATLNEPSTVLDLTGKTPVVLREGKGPVEGLL